MASDRVGGVAGHDGNGETVGLAAVLTRRLGGCVMEELDDGCDEESRLTGVRSEGSCAGIG